MFTPARVYTHLDVFFLLFFLSNKTARPSNADDSKITDDVVICHLIGKIQTFKCHSRLWIRGKGTSCRVFVLFCEGVEREAPWDIGKTPDRLQTPRGHKKGIMCHLWVVSVNGF